MPAEVVIRLRNSEKSSIYKYLEYDKITTDDDDPVTTRCMQQALKNFNDEVEKESITIKLIRS